MTTTTAVAGEVHVKKAQKNGAEPIPKCQTES